MERDGVAARRAIPESLAEVIAASFSGHIGPGPWASPGLAPDRLHPGLGRAAGAWRWLGLRGDDEREAGADPGL